MGNAATKIVDEEFLLGEICPRGFNFTDEFTNHWLANQAYAVGDCVRPSSSAGQTGLEYYIASIGNAGQSDGDEEPQWPLVVGGTKSDGSCTWTARVLSNASLLERITSASWTAESGVSVGNEAFVDEAGRQEVNAKITAEAISSKRRAVRVELNTTQGNKYVGIYRIKVLVG